MNMEERVRQTLRTVFADNKLEFDKSWFAGGLTNYNYIMDIRGIKYIIREPGKLTDQMIDRQIEKVNNAIASEFGVNSNCIYFDADTGIKISIYIEDSENIAVANPSAPSNVEAVSALLKKFHKSPFSFPNVFDWKAELEKYEQIIIRQRGELFTDYDSLKAQLLNFMDKHIHSTVSVPCHNDTVPENFLITKSGRTYLIDWEYSGMNDPGFDIAAYIIESRLTEDAIQRLSASYYPGGPSPAEQLKLKCYMMAQDLLWTVWALIRHYSGDDYLDYCRLRYERFSKNIRRLREDQGYSIAEMVNH